MNLIQTANAWMRDLAVAPGRMRLPRGMDSVLNAPPVRSQPPKILLVDDSEINRMVACAQLLRWGIEPTLACDGAQAVELATSQTFDLVLMDVSMPVMDGLEATAQIRRHEQEHPERTRVPVVAYTSGPTADNPGVRARHGIDGVLRKPCSTSKVGECLQQWCGMSLD